jgi:hypothetical protein
MPVRALPVELRLAVRVTLGEALAAALGGDRVHRVDRVAQARVGAALAPMSLSDGVRARAPAMARGALPLHERQAVDVRFADHASAARGGSALDLIERELAHPRLPLLMLKSRPSRRAGAVTGAGHLLCAIHLVR